jgi:hypothetical protein
MLETLALEAETTICNCNGTAILQIYGGKNDKKD